MSHSFGLRSLWEGIVKNKVEVGRPTYILYGSDGRLNRSSWTGKVMKYDAPLSPRGRKLFLGGGWLLHWKESCGNIPVESDFGALENQYTEKSTL